jgi:hypothetical protein
MMNNLFLWSACLLIAGCSQIEKALEEPVSCDLHCICFTESPEEEWEEI